MDPQTTQAVQSALTQLKAPEPEARIAALQQLWDLGVKHPQLTEQIQAIAQNDPVSDVRVAARWALTQLGASESLPAQPLAPDAMPANPVSASFSKNEKQIMALLKQQNNTLNEIYELLVDSSIEHKKGDANLRAQVVDFDMSIGSIFVLFLKSIVASIPILLLIVLIFLIITLLIGGFTVLQLQQIGL